MLLRLICCICVLVSHVGSADAQMTSPFGPGVSDLGGAKLINPGWFTPQDYPVDAIQKEQQGRVIVSFTITAKGKATACVVTQSSGIKALDRVVCPALTRKARFTPAHAADGTPIATTGRMNIDLWIPGAGN